MDLGELSNNWLPIVGAISFVAWLIRLEAKMLYLEKDHMEQKTKVTEKIDMMQATLINILQSLAKIEGRLERKQEDYNG